MNLNASRVAAIILTLSTFGSLAQPAVTTSATTNRVVDAKAAEAAKDVRHSPRWYEGPVKDPATLLKELQTGAQSALSDTPTFTFENGYYKLVSTKSESEPLSASPSGDKLSAWDATPLHKETPVDFSTVSRSPGYAVSLPNFSNSNSAPVQYASSDLADQRALRVSGKAPGDDLDPMKTRVTEGEGLSVPGTPLRAQPQIASPEPNVLLLGALALGAWRFLSFRRRQ